MPETSTKKANQSSSAKVRIEKLVYGGEGLARIDGQVVLTPFVLPGEHVEVATERVKAGLLRGSGLHVLDAAPQRVIPRCEYFATCGGCHYQHADYAFELQQKREILREVLRRLAGLVYDGEIHVVSGDPWFYRNRIQLHFVHGESGFHKTGSHDLCAIDHCYIASPVLVDAIAKFRTAVREPQWPAFLRSLEVFTNETTIQLNVLDATRPVAGRFFEWCGTFLGKLAPGPIEYAALGFTYRISRGSFFQVNRFLVDSLVSEVLGQETGRHAVDLYAGVGLFSLPLSQRFQRVQAVERSRGAYRDLEWNARQFAATLRIANVSAEQFLRELEETPDLIVADPPRAGIGKEATAELLRIKPGKLTIVSCDPATLARDIKKLLSQDRIARLTLIDLFPRTYHLEVAAHLERC